MSHSLRHLDAVDQELYHAYRMGYFTPSLKDGDWVLFNLRWTEGIALAVPSWIREQATAKLRGKQFLILHDRALAGPQFFYIHDNDKILSYLWIGREKFLALPPEGAVCSSV